MAQGGPRLDTLRTALRHDVDVPQLPVLAVLGRQAHRTLVSNLLPSSNDLLGNLLRGCFCRMTDDGVS